MELTFSYSLIIYYFMKKTSLIFSLSAICLFLFASGDKNVFDGPDPVGEETCGIRLNIESPAPLTKAGDTDYLEGEVNLNKIDVFVFRVTSGADNGMLDSYKSAETSEINNTAHSAQIVMTSSTGSFFFGS